MIVLMQQRHPSEMSKVREVKRVVDDGGNKEAVRGAWQMWHRNGTRCPKETEQRGMHSETDQVPPKSVSMEAFTARM
jgi:hypothetical protein